MARTDFDPLVELRAARRLGRRPLLAADAAGTPGIDDDEGRAARERLTLRERLQDLQRRLWAERRRSLLVVFQAMDAGGKDGAIRNVFSGLDPRALRCTAFGPPSAEEASHDFLWRIHPHAPAAGEVAVWNRSHYEDVVVPRIAGTLSAPAARARAAHALAFERLLADAGTTVIKVWLHIDRDEQRKRLQARIDDPGRRWKLDASDLEARARWDDYLGAWGDAIRATDDDACPWFVVPANRKWYRDWAVLSLVVATLERMKPRYPKPAEGTEHLRVR